MGEKLDAAITNLQDFVLDRLGKVMTELETADLTGRILLLVNESRFPFELEILDMSHGVVITVPDQYSVEEVIDIRRSFIALLKSETPVFVCRGGINIQKLHADLVIAARRFIERCYACRGRGVVEEESETSMNCGVCADLRAALSFFDKHNIPYSREKDTLPSTVEFRNGDPILWKKAHGIFDHYVNESGFETKDPQPDAIIVLDESRHTPMRVRVLDLTPWVHSSSSVPTAPEVFQNGDPVLHNGKAALFDTYIKSVSHGDDRSWHYEETKEPQSQARIRFGGAEVPAGKDVSIVPIEELRFDAPEHD